MQGRAASCTRTQSSGRRAALEERERVGHALAARGAAGEERLDLVGEGAPVVRAPVAVERREDGDHVVDARDGGERLERVEHHRACRRAAGTAWGAHPPCACPARRRARVRRSSASSVVQRRLSPISRAPGSAAAQVESTRPPGHTSAMTARILLVHPRVPRGRMRIRREARDAASRGRQARRPHHQRARDLVRGRAGPAHRVRARPRRALREGPRRAARVRVRRRAPRRPRRRSRSGAAHLAAAAAAAALRPAGRPRLGAVLPHRAAPARLARDGPEAALARRPRRPARRRDRGLLRRPAALLAAEALGAHRAAAARHLARGPPRSAWPTGSLDAALVDSTRFTRRAQALPAARRRVRRGQARRLRLARGRRRPEAAPRPHEGLLRAHRRRTGRSSASSDRYFAHAARISAIDAGTLLERINTHAAEAQAAFPRGRARLGLRLAPHRRHRLPGVALGPARHLAHGRARPHDAHRGHGRAPAGEGPPRRAREHPRRRALPRAAAPTRCRRASASPTAPTSRSPPTTSASATSRTRASSRSARACRRTRGRT